jgi:8-oxo-dGTP pyrophosphatase MutT (NUDIX family)
MQSNLSFQYCQKLVIVSADLKSVLLAKRKGEADYDSTYSFIGGKMETTDDTMLAGMEREKYEEIGMNAKVLVLPDETRNLLFRKKDGSAMILPHIAGIFKSGAIELNDEYSNYAWVPLAELTAFEPKIENIPSLTAWAVNKLQTVDRSELVEI